MALGYEDLNDHDALRHDPALQTAVGRDVDMSSASTLCRFENSVDAKSLWALSSVLVDVFVESHKKAPDEIILDFDATDDEAHGRREGRFFHAYYQFRVPLSALAYTLLNTIRQKSLAGTELARARCDTIRLKLLKIGASVIRNTRRVTLMPSAFCPYKILFRLAAARLHAG